MNDLSPTSTELSTGPLSPQTNPEVQEALSKVYAIAAIVVPLNTGKFAVFANDRSLDSMIICQPDDLPIVIPSRAKLSPKKTNVPQSIPASKLAAIDFSDL